MEKLRVGILGATGMVGQRFVSLLADHPWFEVTSVAASPRSAGKKYLEAVEGRWAMKNAIPRNAQSLIVKRVEEDIGEIADNVDFVFSALDMDKEAIKRIEESYAGRGIPVVSNNSAHRWTDDIPMIIPEVNPGHIELIKAQRSSRGWKKGFIVVKPNCSIQGYVPVLKALESYRPKKVIVTTLQAISGAGKTFESMPEILDNVIPFIKNEEEKSEKEPMKILGKISKGKIALASMPEIFATCIRVPVTDGHMASVSMKLGREITKEEFIGKIESFNPIAELKLPSAPRQFIKYFNEENRPQTKLDRDYGNGMGLAVGRLRQDNILGWDFISLSHNTIRGAAGGAILTAELLRAKKYI